MVPECGCGPGISCFLFVLNSYFEVELTYSKLHIFKVHCLMAFDIYMPVKLSLHVMNKFISMEISSSPLYAFVLPASPPLPTHHHPQATTAVTV